jgi:hypothetical protein
MRTPVKEGDACPKCGGKLRLVLCAICYGTGKSGKRICKTCEGSGIRASCPNFRSHRMWLGRVLSFSAR